LEPGDDAIIEEEMKYSYGPILFSTAELGHPVRFTVGAGQVIEGIDSGVRGMKVGEVRELVIPPRLSK
jgi:peptidylprolyl isomerase